MKTYIAIDLKSFYASVECVERGLNPLKALLVVADASRTNKTICLAVTPALKAYGLSGRSRLFEVEAKAAEIKRQTGRPLNYIIAVPRMSLYMEYSAKVYGIYLNYFSPEDVHVYSIDEVFIDATSYLPFYKTDAHSLTVKVIHDVLSQTGITATAGIAPNLYLCKIAMDIVAKHIPADKDGVRIAELDEISYRKLLWDHKPITDFWRVGNGTQNRLSKQFLFTMGDIARRSLENPGSLYKLFGIDAEILIDHAWGYESVGMKDIKAYHSQQKSISSGQVLHEPYSYEKTEIIVREMAELLALDLFEKKLLASSVSLYLGYDRENCDNNFYKGEVCVDYYGRFVPKPAHGTVYLSEDGTNSSSLIVESIVYLFKRIADPQLTVRRVNLCANEISSESGQLLLFEDNSVSKEDSLQHTRLQIIKKFGKNALLKGFNYCDGATTRDRNSQIGGHKA